MRDDDTFAPSDRTRRRVDPSRLAEFTATARRLQEERATSAEIVERLLNETPRADWLTLADRSEMHTNGVLESLAQLADTLEHDPREALVIAELATHVADAIPDDAYPRVMLAQMRAHAWKERGRALCYLGRHEESLLALEAAVERLCPHIVLSHDLAIVNFVRASVLQQMRRFSEAQALLKECRTVFREHGDWRRYGECTLAMGNLLVRRGDYAAARGVLSPFLRRAKPEARAIARTALGWCAIHIGDAEEALDHFTYAMDASRQLNWPLEVVRTSYGVGAALLRLNRIDEAIATLTNARERFLAHELIEEAGLCGLELVEAYLVARRADEARSLASRIVWEFTNAALNRRAISAIASLNDAIEACNATPETARSVQAYVASLRTEFDHDCGAMIN